MSRLLALELLGIEGEEVFFEGYADLEQQIGADTVARENIVDVSAIATKLLREPHDTLTLVQQFLVDFIPNIYACFSHQVYSSFSLC